MATSPDFNVTVDQPTSSGFLTVWPTGETQPLASSHNFVAGLTIANLVLAKVGAGGQISIFNNAGQTHVVQLTVTHLAQLGERTGIRAPGLIPRNAGRNPRCETVVAYARVSRWSIDSLTRTW